MSKRNRGILLSVLAGIILGLIVLFLFYINTHRYLFSEQIHNIFATSDTPYDYGLEPQSEKWHSLSTQERKQIYVIPESVIENMSTKAFLETILNNPYLVDIHAYDSIIMGIDSKESVMHIKKFLSREDALFVLEGKITELSDKYGLTVENWDLVEDEKLINIVNSGLEDDALRDDISNLFDCCLFHKYIVNDWFNPENYQSTIMVENPE